jgi:lipopolysaccharide biosynthesis protein
MTDNQTVTVVDQEIAQTLLASQRPVTAAFYLPQFHPIPENDGWWGEGFTEWRNVARANPLFDGHHQPARPDTPFGEYSLLDPDVVAWQTELAAAHDVDAFIYYHYWFDGQRLLEQPLDMYLKTDLPHGFAICWANENWTRRWDGKQHDVLMGQRYDDSTPLEVFASFVPYLSDPRYLRLDGRAVVMVHRADQLPEPAAYAGAWRAEAVRLGLGELWLVASETTHGLHPRVLGFDAIAEFPPVGDSTLGTLLRRRPANVVNGFKGRLHSYQRLMDAYLARSQPDFVRHPCVVPRWDNTARRGENATCFVGASPRAYSDWLRCAREREAALRGSTGLVLINAWNEWAEGAYLEPDDRYGMAYLEATRWEASSVADGPAPDLSRVPNVGGFLRAAAGSAKARAYRMARARRSSRSDR